MGTLNANSVGEITNYKEALAAVRKDRWELEYVPWKKINLSFPATTKLCLEAVKDYGQALYYVPEELREEVRGRLESGE
jgi:hypothetical protein